MLRKIVAAAGALALAGCVTRPAPPPPVPAPVEVQIIGLNDFHGNLEIPKGTQTVALADGSALNARGGGWKLRQKEQRKKRQRTGRGGRGLSR